MNPRPSPAGTNSNPQEVIEITEEQPPQQQPSTSELHSPSVPSSEVNQQQQDAETITTSMNQQDSSSHPNIVITDSSPHPSSNMNAVFENHKNVEEEKEIESIQKFVAHQSSESLDSTNSTSRMINIQIIGAGIAHVSTNNSPASSIDNMSLVSHDISVVMDDQNSPPRMTPVYGEHSDEVIDMGVMENDHQNPSHHGRDELKSLKSTSNELRNRICVWLMVVFLCVAYVCVVGGLSYYSAFAIEKSVNAFQYFTLNFESKTDCNFNKGAMYKHYSLNSTIVKTCSIQKVLEIDVTKDSFENSDKLTFFYQSSTPMDIYYFKELSSFKTYNSTGYLDPTSVNYWLKSQGQYGFKQLSLSIIDNSTDVEINSNFGVRVVVTLKMMTTETTDSTTLLNALTTLSKSSMDDYQDYNSTSFPLTFQGSYYIESYMCEITLYMTSVALTWIFIILATLVLLTRWKRVVDSKEMRVFIPFSLRKLFCIEKSKKKWNDTLSDTKDHNIGVKLEYEHLTFQDFSGSTHLHSTSGEFLPYTLTALLGESGSGKTTFINSLSKRTSRGKIGGEVFIGGRSLNSESMKRLVGFVPQDDTMIPILTPRETLLFNSYVRNADLTFKGHSERVDKVLRDLKLIKKDSNVSNTIIGNEEKRGISGGEKKRVNVGIEMVTQPPILILDEPTTGLDYLTANKLCKILLEIAKTGKTVICVIHQPAYETFCLFTDLMVFKSKHVVLKGKREVISHEIGYNYLKLNRHANADEILDFVSDTSFEILNDLQVTVEARSNKTEKSTNSNQKTLQKDSRDLEESKSGSPTTPNIKAQKRGRVLSKASRPKDVSPFYHQLFALLVRALIQLYREWFNLIVDAFLNLLGGLLIGILLLNVRADLFQGPLDKSIVLQCPTEKLSVCALPQKDYVSALSSYVILGVSLAGAMSSLRIFGKEKANFVRESQSGVNSFMYFLVKDFLAVIQMLIVSLCFTLTFYYIVLPRASFGVYFAIFLLLNFTVFPVAYCVSVSVRAELRQLTCAIIIFVGYVFCGGVPTLTSINEMSEPLPFFPFISHARYVRELIYLSEVIQYQGDYTIVNSLSAEKSWYTHSTKDARTIRRLELPSTRFLSYFVCRGQVYRLEHEKCKCVDA
ncbi:hypothetical protein C9374_003920 [Naegleria lovaniensis]|uniref:ABC transporter domain-containing protein n=1 Tax=Naegleria lovaniensis TaxID=51637 RepID=A0AA88H5V9_NAELO|nr:uncharacterized protein C9374_003920 [Naegleria lovaniensis]KAG2394156.1 hypothetical protein C9374_003920 [Naegleria lovaniensis]